MQQKQTMQQQQLKQAQPKSQKPQMVQKDFNDLTNQPPKQSSKGMAQTAYDQGFGAQANPNFYGQQQQQQKMSNSHYGKGFPAQAPKESKYTASSKLTSSAASRQPHPDISIKKSGSLTTSTNPPQNAQMYNMSQLTNEQKLLLMQMQKKGQVPQSSTSKKTTVQMGAQKKSSSGLGQGKF